MYTRDENVILDGFYGIKDFDSKCVQVDENVFLEEFNGMEV